MSKQAEFKKELDILLNKHGVSILFECDEYSDLYGVFDPRIEVEFKDGSRMRLGEDGWEYEPQDATKSESK